jgi:hypothetical protein
MAGEAFMVVIFENDFKNKILTMSFKPGSALKSQADVASWKTQWTQALTSWHSPYKVLADFSELALNSDQELDPNLRQSVQQMLDFFSKFFMRSIVGYAPEASVALKSLPMEIFTSEEDASAKLGIRGLRTNQSGDFRASIQFDNHFEQNVIELHFLNAVRLSDANQIQTIQSKLMNNLMQWHSAWNLIVDCSTCSFEPDGFAAFQKMLARCKGFFMKTCVGYGGTDDKTLYPFPMYRARHRAAAAVQGDESSGRAANCQTRKKKPTAEGL